MPWGVHSEYTEEEGPEVDVDEEQEAIDRAEEGEEHTETFDVADALDRLD